jgi:hypothetical protein
VRADRSEDLREISRAVRPCHSLQHAIRAGLEREMKMRRESSIVLRELGETEWKSHRLDAAQSEPPEPFDREDASDETFECLRWIEARSIGAEVDAREHDLEVALKNEVPDGFDDVLGLSASCAASDAGNDAVRACGVASVLDLHEGSGPVHDGRNRPNRR